MRNLIKPALSLIQALAISLLFNNCDIKENNSLDKTNSAYGIPIKKSDSTKIKLKIKKPEELNTRSFVVSGESPELPCENYKGPDKASNKTQLREQQASQFSTREEDSKKTTGYYRSYFSRKEFGLNEDVANFLIDGGRYDLKITFLGTKSDTLYQLKKSERTGRDGKIDNRENFNKEANAVGLEEKCDTFAIFMITIKSSFNAGEQTCYPEDFSIFYGNDGIFCVRPFISRVSTEINYPDGLWRLINGNLEQAMKTTSSTITRRRIPFLVGSSDRVTIGMSSHNILDDFKLPPDKILYFKDDAGKRIYIGTLGDLLYRN